MLKNYIKVAFRNILRNKAVSFINIFGMALGLAVCFMIGLYLIHEFSYDRFIPESERVVRIVQRSDQGPIAVSPPGLSAALENEVPAVEVLTNVDRPRRRLLKVGDENTYVDNVVTVDPFFLEVFPFQVLRGAGPGILEEPGKLLLTESTAYQLFGTEEPIGKTVLLDNNLELEVAGIVEDPPANFHFSFNVLVSLTTEEHQQARYDSGIVWNYYSGGYNYIRLTPGTTMADFQQQLNYFEEQQEKPEFMADGGNLLLAQALTDIHLSPVEHQGDIALQGNRTSLALFSVIGLLILGIAIFNYMTLSTARSATRSQEVGIRKVAGATKKELLGQFLGESLLISLCSFPLAIALLELLSPLVTGVLGIELAYSLSGQPLLLLAALLATTVVGLMAGCYPAFVLSSTNTAGMLKSRGGQTGKSGFRKSLVVSQFAVSIVLLIVTVVIWQQMQYVQQKQLGFDSENVLTFSTSVIGDQYPAFRQELLRSPHIAGVSSGPPLGIGHWSSAFFNQESEARDATTLYSISTDYDYLRVMGLTILAGRDFSPDHADDAIGAVLLNETAVQALELGDDPVGERISTSFTSQQEIIGVIEDFHNESLYETVVPVMIQLWPGNRGSIVARLASGNLNDGVDAVEAVWREFVPDRPFEFMFLDDRIDALYSREQRLGILFAGFSGIAIVIAGLGLFGLASFVTAIRIREIGIRKVLGASVASILTLLNKDFLKLVAIGFVLAIPIAWYAMNRWLEDFAYRIEISPGVFLLAGAAAILIALLTVSWQSVKAAVANPVTSLRSE